ncbi:MAG: PAS domain-containing protein, partial [Candidatus Jacksonbacteria bacterium]|nr:PAS domain-containing protein [Candidatus Jacksonbacteria bacterium]
TDYDILSKSEAERVRAVDAKVIKTERPQIIEEEMISANGKIVYLSHKIPLRNKKNIVIG